MPLRSKYSIFCVTENTPVEAWSTTPITTCPNNASHTVIPTSVQFTDINTTDNNLFDTIVATTLENGNYTSIAQAFADGNSNVYVRNGTYNETSSIIIPNGGKLVGESPGGVSVVFSGGNSITVDGSSGIKQTAGTIAVINDSKDVVGTGTSFTSLTPGSYILIGGIYLQIATIIDDTNIQLLNKYRGPTRSAEPYIAQSMFTGITLRFLLVSSPLGPGLYFRGCRFCNVQNVILAQCFQNLIIEDSGDISFEAFMSINSVAGPSIVINNSVNIYFNYCNVLNNLNHGIHITNNSNSITFATGGISCNTGSGVLVDNGSYNVTLATVTFRQNSSVGVNVSNGTSGVVTDACIFEDNALAIRLSGASCVVSDCNLYNNDDGIEIYDENSVDCTNIENCMNNALIISANRCIISGNRIKNNGGVGIRNDGMDSIFTGNMVYGNTAGGVEFTLTAADNILTSNNLKGNTGFNLSDNGTGTVNANNLV